MRSNSLHLKRYKKKRPVARIVIIAILLIFHANIFYFLFKDTKDPVIELSPITEGKTALKTIFTAKVTDSTGIDSLSIIAYRNDQSMTIFSQEFEVPPTEFETEFQFADIKLPDGEFTLEIKANDSSFARFGFGNKETKNYNFVMDTEAPKISVLTRPANIKRGGSALIRYSSDEDVVKTGIQIEDTFVPAFKNENGEYVCIFPFPYNMTMSNYVPEIMAVDDAGNITSSRLLVNLNNRIFIDDLIKVDDKFLNRKKDVIDRLVPGDQSLIDKYKIINKDIRHENLATFAKVTDESADHFLFTDTFMRQPNAALRGGFGDTRTYTYNGEKFDYQFHTGLDYASVAEDVVRATNKGKVIFIDNVGIFGNTIIIDHGLGVHSLYAHLTDIHVNVGDEVEKNSDIGTTGITGMVLGDHVHYSILVGGIPVQPAEWLDEKWVKNNITSRMK